jgi:hypothetical protein
VKTKPGKGRREAMLSDAEALDLIGPLIKDYNHRADHGDQIKEFSFQGEAGGHYAFAFKSEDDGYATKRWTATELRMMSELPDLDWTK